MKQTKKGKIAKRKTTKVKFCANCLREIGKCNCVLKVVEIGENCPNCGSSIYEDDHFCSECGKELYE